MKFWIWVYSRFSCKWPLKLLNKRPRLKHKNWCKSVICWPILMKFCVQPPIRHPFALANFQLGRKGQRPKGRKVKRPNFQKLSEAFLIKSKVVPNVFMSIFKLKGPISRNFALELIVWYRNIIRQVLLSSTTLTLDGWPTWVSVNTCYNPLVVLVPPCMVTWLLFIHMWWRG